MGRLDERISTLETRLKQLKAQQVRAASRQRALEVRRSRKNELRRKILVGAIVLNRVGREKFSKAELLAWLYEELTRAEDRALFDLPAAIGRGSDVVGGDSGAITEVRLLADASMSTASTGWMTVTVRLRTAALGIEDFQSQGNLVGAGDCDDASVRGGYLSQNVLMSQAPSPPLLSLARSSCSRAAIRT